MTGTSINIDMTAWPTPARIELLELVGRIEAELAGGECGASDPAPQLARPAVPDEVEPSGWNKEAYIDVLTKLLSRHHVQVAVIFEAIKNGTGYVSRDKVYELGNYPATRSLKGFTRPVNRFTADAVEAGLLEEDADDLLTPDYDPNVSSFQRAMGFRVPMEVVKMANEWREEAERERNAR